MNMSDRKDRDETFPRNNAAERIGGDADNLRLRLEETEKQADENLRLLQRTQADFINYRRRLEQEKDEQASLGKSQVILKILPVLDDFKLALASLEKGGAEQNWVQGVELIHRKLNSVLESEGVKRIEAEGQEFDPWEHEAVLHVPSDKYPSGIVMEVLRDGYKMGNRVIRPAQVRVSKGRD